MVGDFNDVYLGTEVPAPSTFLEKQFDLKLSKMGLAHHMNAITRSSGQPRDTCFRGQQSSSIDHCIANLSRDLMEQCYYSAVGDWAPSGHVLIWIGLCPIHYAENHHHREPQTAVIRTIDSVRIDWTDNLLKQLFTSLMVNYYPVIISFSLTQLSRHNNSLIWRLEGPSRLNEATIDSLQLDKKLVNKLLHSRVRSGLGFNGDNQERS